jgi:hypothetical protein
VAAEPAVAAGGVFVAVFLFGPAATLAASSNDENTTTVEVARMRDLRPALAGDFRPRVAPNTNRRFFL